MKTNFKLMVCIALSGMLHACGGGGSPTSTTTSAASGSSNTNSSGSTASDGASNPTVPPSTTTTTTTGTSTPTVSPSVPGGIIPPTFVASSAAFDGTSFYVFSETQAAYKSVSGTNGSKWLPVTGAGPISGAQTIRRLNSKWVGTGTAGTVHFGDDALNWTSRATGLVGNVFDVEYGSGRYVAVSKFDSVSQKNIAWSDDGITWTVASNPLPTAGLIGVRYVGTKFVAIGNVPGSFSSGVTATSSDGKTWVAGPTIPALLQAISFRGTDIVVVGNQGAIFTSQDAVTWTKQSTLTSTNLLRVLCSSSACTASGSSNGTSAPIITSTNLTTWTAAVIATPFDLWGLSTDGSNWIAVAQQDYTGVSSDAKIWTKLLP